MTWAELPFAAMLAQADRGCPPPQGRKESPANRPNRIRGVRHGCGEFRYRLVFLGLLDAAFVRDPRGLPIRAGVVRLDLIYLRPLP